VRLKYLGDGAGAPCVVFGLSFPPGEWVSVEKPPAKLLANPLFAVEKPVAPKPAPPAPKPPEKA
jgi:hypothetical protein